MVNFLKKIKNSNKFNSYMIPILLKDIKDYRYKFCGVYKITNKINGKCYIGLAIDIRKRLQSHIAASERGSNLLIYKAINKYGIESFEVTILIIINIFDKTLEEIKKELNALEIFYINLYNSYLNGYNSTPGGDSSRLGFKHSEETILKLKNIHYNYKPKIAFTVSKNTYCYDIVDKIFIEATSILNMSNKTCIDYRSISAICNNIDYKSGGRFYSGKRYLFSFTKNDLSERIDWFYSRKKIKN